MPTDALGNGGGGRKTALQEKWILGRGLMAALVRKRISFLTGHTSCTGYPHAVHCVHAGRYRSTKPSQRIGFINAGFQAHMAGAVSGWPTISTCFPCRNSAPHWLHWSCWHNLPLISSPWARRRAPSIGVVTRNATLRPLTTHSGYIDKRYGVREDLHRNAGNGRFTSSWPNK